MKQGFVRGRRFLLVATLAMCAGAMAISACDDNNDNGTEGLSGGAITVTAAPTDLTLEQGTSGTVDVTIGRSGEFEGPVVLKTGTVAAGIHVIPVLRDASAENGGLGHRRHVVIFEARLAIRIDHRDPRALLARVVKILRGDRLIVRSV